MTKKNEIHSGMFKGLFVICFILVICLIKESSSFCKPFDEDSGLARLCEYSATANFTYLSQYNKAIKNAEHISSRFRPCSEYAAIIGCSLHVPRCEANIPGPFLPCRRVCTEFIKKCMKQIFKLGLQWIIGTCQLLPEKDDPNTKLGYLGRCFEPPNFKTNLNKNTPIKCSKLIVPDCQNLGYTKTDVSEDNQKAFSSWITSKLQQKNNNSACDLPQKKLFCMEHFSPCLEDKIGSYCRPNCEKYFEMNCTTPYKSSDYVKCTDSPIKKSNVSDICYYTDWPKSWNWPEVRKRQELELAPTTTRRPEGAGTKDKVMSPTIATSSPDIFSTRPSTKEIKEDSKTDPIRRGTEGPNKPKMSVLLGGAFALLFVILVVIVITVVLHRKRQMMARQASNVLQQDKLL